MSWRGSPPTSSPPRSASNSSSRRGPERPAPSALQFVAHAEPDGYNFVITTLSLLALNPIANPKAGYDPLNDLTHVAYLGGSPVAFLVSAASPVKSLADLVARGKTGGRPLTYSSSGVGSNGHLLAEAHPVCAWARTGSAQEQMLRLTFWTRG